MSRWGVPETSGSPKTHFSEQPRFLGTRGDHENERISFPALFCSNLNNESGILSAADSLTGLIAIKVARTGEGNVTAETAHNIKCKEKSREKRFYGRRRKIIARHIHIYK